ncbi:MFS transporter [Paenibacillus donghaensis]|nr:MFS transporter [Paenibacillus donghaensis]
MLMNQKLGRMIWNILIGTLFTRTALFMSTPFLAIFLTNQKEISIIHTGYILGINPLINVLFGGLGGGLADRFSLKKIIGYVPIAWGGVFILFYYADSFWQFLLLSGLNGLCYSIFEPASKKVLSSQSNQTNRLLVFNLRYTAINLGAFAGPLLSLLFNMRMTLFPYVILGVLYILYGMSTQLFFAESSGAVSPVSATPLVSPTPHKPQQRLYAFHVLLKNPVYLLLLAGVSFSFFGYSQLNSTVSQYMANSNTFADGIRLYSTLLSANAVIILAAQFILLRWISGWNPFNVILTSNLLISLSFLCFVFPSSYLMLLVFIVLFSVGEMLIGARFDALVDELAPEEAKGLYFGSSEWVRTGTIGGPIIGTLLLDQFGFHSGLPVFGLLSVLTIAGAGLIHMAKFNYRRGNY